MFNTKYGPMSIIYSFIPIFDIYKLNLICISKNIKEMVLNQIHLYIFHNISKNSILSHLFVKDVCNNKLIPISIILKLFDICIANYNENANPENLCVLFENPRIRSTLNEKSVNLLSHFFILFDLPHFKRISKAYNNNYSGFNRNIFKKAVSCNRIEIMKFLIDSHENIFKNIYINNTIRIVTKYGKYKAICFVLKYLKKVDPIVWLKNTTDDETEQNMPYVLMNIIKNNSDIDSEYLDNYIIRKASEHGCVDLVKILLSNPDADPTAYNNYALKKAQTNKHKKIVKLLIDRISNKESRIKPISNTSYFGLSDQIH